MTELWSSIVVFLLLSGSAVVGFFIQHLLPETHRTRESIELVHLAIGMLVTFAALVLGLLTASVKSSYDSADRYRRAYAAELTQLDQCMRNYGPGSELVRSQLQSYVAAVIASTWPSEPPPKGVSYPDISRMARIGPNPTLADLMNHIGLEIRQLQPRDPLQEKLVGDCVDQYKNTLNMRWAVIEATHGSISTPFYRILVFWLMVVFTSFGLCAPRNRMVIIVLGLCAFSLTSVLFIILDMDVPYGGLFGISSQSMRDALHTMMR